MKNRTVWLLLVIEILFLAALLGFYLGRNTGDTPVHVSQVPTETQATQAATETTGPLLVNINTATAEEFEKLPGIGPVLAKTIVEYRTAHGPFASLSELTKVDGIGPERLNKILDYITLGGEP